MAVVVFPPSLPGPSKCETTGAERRLVSDLPGGPTNYAATQRDYLATQEIEWNLLTPYQAEKFNIWWTYNLLQGGLWFKSTWPAPQGWVGLVRRFVGIPRWTHLQAGHWRVTATVQVRGKGLDPDALYTTMLSAPYPVVLVDYLDAVHAVVGGRLQDWPLDNLDVVHSLVSGSLTQPLSAYTNWPVEKIDALHDVISGVLTQVLLTYGLWPAENLDVAHSVGDGTLTIVLFTYSNALVENLDVTHSIIGGTLT